MRLVEGKSHWIGSYDEVACRPNLGCQTPILLTIVRPIRPSGDSQEAEVISGITGNKAERTNAQEDTCTLEQEVCRRWDPIPIRKFMC